MVRAGSPLVVSGTVQAAPLRWLRVEGLALLTAAVVGYAATGRSWWLLPLTILLPDVLALGYLAGPRVGAQLYNVAHATPVPAALLGLAVWRDEPLLAALALVWLAHIGMDRAVGYGLKYGDDFRHTHLGWIGPRERRATRPDRTRS